MTPYIPKIEDFKGRYRIVGSANQLEHYQSYIDETSINILSQLLGADFAEIVLAGVKTPKIDFLFDGGFYSHEENYVNCLYESPELKSVSNRKRFFGLTNVLKGLLYFEIVRDDFQMTDAGAKVNNNDNSQRVTQLQIAKDRFNRSAIDYEQSVIPLICRLNKFGVDYDTMVFTGGFFNQPLNTFIELGDFVTATYENLTSEGSELITLPEPFEVIEMSLVYPEDNIDFEVTPVIANIVNNPENLSTNTEPFYGEVGNLTCGNDDYVRWNLPEPTEDEPDPAFDVRIMYDDVTDNVPRNARPVSYEMTIRQRGNSPKQFTCDGWDDDTETWVILDQQDLDDWKGNENRRFPLNTPNEYAMYRIRVTETNGNGNRLTLETLRIESLVEETVPDCNCPVPEPKPIEPTGYLLKLRDWNPVLEINGFNIFTVNIFPEPENTQHLIGSGAFDDIYVVEGVVGNTVVTETGPTTESIVWKVINNPDWGGSTDVSFTMIWYFPEVFELNDRLRDIAKSVIIRLKVNPDEQKGLPTKIRVAGNIGGIVYLTPMLDVEFEIDEFGNAEVEIPFTIESSFQEAYGGYQFTVFGATDEFLEFTSVEFRGPALEVGLNYKENITLNLKPYEKVKTQRIGTITP